jgi:hypothetical protein
MVEKLSIAQILHKYGKRCPKCGSEQISSNNSDPMWHRCLDCKAKFPDTEAARPPKGGWPDAPKQGRDS